MVIKIDNEKDSYDIVIEKEMLAHINDYIDFPNKVMVITDDQIPNQYLDCIKKYKEDIVVYKIPAGEKSKSISNYQAIICRLLGCEFSKTDLIIALGGGVVGDLSAFVASTYKRGISFINIPTSLLAIIDSSIGGKTALNMDYCDYYYKNAVGSFYMPVKVLVSLDVIKTLSRRHFYNGLFEIIKTGFIGDEKLLNMVLGGQEFDIPEIIYRSIQVKKAIVEQDPYEKNIRKYLNFGHTLGHAIEASNIDHVLHGEAVAIGMIPFILDSVVKARYLEFIKKYLTDLKIAFSKEIIISEVMNDKKWNHGFLDVVVVREVGFAEIKQYSREEIVEVINEINFWK